MVAALDSEASEGLDIETLARYVVDLQLPVVLEAVEQAEKDTAEKIAQAIEAPSKLCSSASCDICAVQRIAADKARALARSGGGTPEQGEAT